MRLLEKTKDGGPDSPVDAYFLCEFKNLFSIALLKFNKGSRDTFHTHAFNAWTWFLSGKMVEIEHITSMEQIHEEYKVSLLPKFTGKDKNHLVVADRDSWAFTIRGPWDKTWTETQGNLTTILGHNRELKGWRIDM